MASAGTGKQATVYIIDVGKDMGAKHNSRTETDLEYGMRYVWDKVAGVMSANRATWLVGVTGLRTDETQNACADNPDLEGYDNICQWKTLGSCGMNDVRNLQPKIVPSRTVEGDTMSAIALAVQEITEATMLKTGKPGKFDRKIVLLTNGRGYIDPDGLDEHLDEIAKKINAVDMQLSIIGVDFDDAEYGFKEEDKDQVKGDNEAILKSLADKCSNGVFGTLDEAIDSLSVPDVKVSRPYSPYKGKLTLGDPEAYPNTTMEIDVERYFRTKSAKAPSASRFVTRVPGSNGSNSDATMFEDVDMADAPEGNDLSAVRNARSYKVSDPSAPGGKRDVDSMELSKGYAYGSTAVAISESEENVTKLETKQSFSIIGFVPSSKYERYLNMGESCITIAPRTDEEARIALSSLIHALHELDSYAVARIVLKENKDPQIILLAPYIEPDIEGLIDVPLPFAEDVRTYRFPPLDRVITNSGNVLTSHRNLPSDDLQKAMSNYVDSMDLSEIGRDDEGEPTEYMPIQDTFSPLVHRIQQAIRRRAIKPDEPVQPPAPVLLKWCNPPDEVLKASEPQVNKLIATADLKKVPAKVKGKRNRDTVKPLSGLDVDALLGREKRQKITPENAIPEFKQMLDNADSDSALIAAATQMSSIIRTLITKSFGDIQYDQAAENMRVIREAMIEMEIPEVYNDFVRDLKKRVIKGELGGDRTDFWFASVRRNKLGLIDNGASPSSTVSEVDAKVFYNLKEG